MPRADVISDDDDDLPEGVADAQKGVLLLPAPAALDDIGQVDVLKEARQVLRLTPVRILTRPFPMRSVSLLR